MSQEQHIEELRQFLEANRFECISDNRNQFRNDKCTVTFDSDGYTVRYKTVRYERQQVETLYSDKLNIHWLNAMLIYHELIDKDCKN